MSAPKLSNLDCTRRAAVKKGCVVQFAAGGTARVDRVRLGMFWTNVGARVWFFPCSVVKVISS